MENLCAHQTDDVNTSSVAPDKSRVLTVKLGHETSLTASTDKRSTS